MDDEALQVAASRLWARCLAESDHRSGGHWVPDDGVCRRIHRRDPGLLHPRLRDLTGLDPCAEPSDGLANELLDRAQDEGDEDALQQCVSACRSLIAGDGDPALPGRLATLCAALATRFDFSGARGDLHEAVLVGRRALTLAEPDDPERVRFLSNLAAALATRWELEAAGADLGEAVTLARDAVRLRPPDDNREAGYLANLAALLELQATQEDSSKLLDEAVTTARRSVEAAAGLYSEADQAGFLTNLCNVLLTRFRRTGRSADLADAVLAATRAEQIAPKSHPERHIYLTGLANVVATRFELQGDPDDLDHALELCRDAVACTPVGHLLRARYLSNLGHLLLTRFVITVGSADLDEAIEAVKEAVGSADGIPERTAYLTNLGNALLTRFEHRGTSDDLTQGVEAHRQAVGATQADHPGRTRYLLNLCSAAHLRYTVEGDPDDLATAVRAGREAADRLPPGHLDRPMCLTNLATALHTRYSRLRIPRDLDQAVELSHEAVRTCPAKHPQRAHHLAGLATALRTRSAERTDPADLEEAVRLIREAATALGPDPEQRAALWAGLGNTLLTDTASRSDEELSEAVEAHRTAVEATNPHHLHHRFRLVNLSTAYAARFARLHQAKDLDAAITTIRQAIGGTAAADPDAAKYLSNLGLLLSKRYDITRAAADRDEAIESLRAAATSQVGAAAVRVGAAYSWAELAMADGDHPSALAGFVTAVELLPQVAWRGTDQPTREAGLVLWPGLATDAAACALEAGLPERAVELLEQGRSVLWAQTLETRTDFSALRAEDPELAEQVERTARLLHHLETTADLQSTDVFTGDLEVPGAAAAEAVVRDDRIRLAEKWNRLVDQVRERPGLRTFLAPTPFAELARAAEQGAVVVVNVSRLRCDALVVTVSDVRVIPLPRLTVTGLARTMAAYVRLLGRLRDRPHLDVTQHEPAEELRMILRWLWDAVAAPVLNALELQHRDDGWPRLWWCPTGLLALLPLHAAQRYDGARMQESGVPDRVVSSYTPTLGRLLAARSAEPAPPATRRALVVGFPETPGLPSLPNADRELHAVIRSLTMPATLLRGEEATWEAVTGKLPEHSWLHFTGHSGQNLARPGRASLFLHDRPLTALQLSHVDLSSASFAFLSSCESGLGGTALPDEALHLAGALQVVGYSQVIATLWSIGDDTAPVIAGNVHASLALAPATEAARILHTEVRRARTRHSALVWAAYCHTGM